MNPDKKKLALWVAAIFCAAFLARMIFLLDYAKTPLYNLPIIDAKGYDNQARDIAAGDWLSGDKVLYQAPLYSYFLAAVYYPTNGSRTLARLIQILLGSASCVLIYLLGRRVFGQAAGLVAGFTASLYGLLIFYEVQLLRSSLVIFLTLASLMCLLRAAGRIRYRWWAASGFLLGLAAITRESILLFVPLALYWLIRSSAAEEGKKRILVASTLFVLSAASCIIPVTARNYVVGRELVMISAQGGMNFFIGNNPEEGRTTNLQPGEEWNRMVRMPSREGGIVTASGNSRWFFRKSFEHIRDDPLWWMGLMLKKLYFFFHGYEVTPNNNIDFHRSNSGILRALVWTSGPLCFPFGIVAPLALAGMVLAWRRRDGAFLLVLYTVATTASVVLFHVRSRYRLPVVPVLLVFAAFFVVYIWQARRKGELRSAVVPLLCACAALFVLNFNFFDIRSSPALPVHTALGHLYYGEGEMELAFEELQKAIKEDPGDGPAYETLGMIYESRGMEQPAYAAFVRALELNPESSNNHTNMGQFNLKKGRNEQALAHLKRAIELDPGNAMARYNLGILHYNRKLYSEALQELRLAAGLEPSFPDVHFNLGAIYLTTGDYSAAADAFGKVLALEKNSPDAQRYYNQALSLKNRQR